MHTAKSLKDNIYIYIYRSFIQHRKFLKNILACVFCFNNKFIKVMRTRPIFQKKIYIMFSFGIQDYDLIRKMYS
jgi:hypothetical protein